MPDGGVRRRLDQAKEHMMQMTRQSAISATAGLVDDIVKDLLTKSESNPYLGVVTFKQPRGSLSTVGPQDWMEIELTVDSGACGNAGRRVPTNILARMLGTKQGYEYEVANEEVLPNCFGKVLFVHDGGFGIDEAYFPMRGCT